MNRKPKVTKEPVFVPEDLQQFIGWEIRKINTSDRRTGIIMQDPDSGEKRKLLFQPSLFDGECMRVVRRKN